MRTVGFVLCWHTTSDCLSVKLHSVSCLHISGDLYRSFNSCFFLGLLRYSLLFHNRAIMPTWPRNRR
ncbi:unnamed protein product [Angiostrongylus costaricensis]|uniref:Secreted protein n=1 Tax=Angiostrongylus costaricensis TaxID=334426 RepID=A0A0R3PWE4_ANGCS|nr:unnamed protein product [Angiostrongylus costaricensis]